jgi:DNA repair protein RadA/Sms
MGGEPGIGKSTLVLQAAASASRLGRRTLLVAAEESAEQVRRRAERLGVVVDECYIVATSDLQTALEVAGNLNPDLVVVDSIQTVGDPSIASPLGSITQVRECAQALAHFAKATSTATVLVGHVTKDGGLAGPRTLEHLVDTVLSFEGDRHHALRMLTATKHRFGSAGELGLFEMAESGLVGLADPSSLLLGDRQGAGPGMVVAPIIEGRRPLLVEVQALVSPTRASTPRRVVQGIPPSRLALLLAVLEQSARIPVRSLDVFVSTVGGIRVTEPAADLAVALAVASAISGVPITKQVVAFGEIGLSGEIRQSPGAPRRLSEAERLGFARAFAPHSSPCSSGTIEVVHVTTIGEAVTALGLMNPGGRTGSHESGSAAQAAGRKTVVSRGANGSSRRQPGAPARKQRGGLTVVRD